MSGFEENVKNFFTNKMKKDMKKKYVKLINLAMMDGVYIWGYAELGHFANKQCTKNEYRIRGFIDNDAKKINKYENVFPYTVLKENDVVLIASMYYPEIIEQLKSLHINNYIYYEEFATMMEGFDNYYQSFVGNFEEIENEKKEYLDIYSILEDDLSKEIYENVMFYKMTLDSGYTVKAFDLSIPHGKQDFDELVISRLKDKKCVFYDVGGFDGDSTKDFIENVNCYDKIFYFEPDRKLIEITKKKFADKKNITYVQAIVGERHEKRNYDPAGKGTGCVAENGTEIVDVITLDDYMIDTISYIKMDIEGYEMNALLGAEKFIARYNPILSISVYHKPGDIHQLIKYVLSLNPKYKVYMRHYTKSYADTRCYFIDDSIFD